MFSYEFYICVTLTKKFKLISRNTIRNLFVLLSIFFQAFSSIKLNLSYSSVLSLTLFAFFFSVLVELNAFFLFALIFIL